MDTEIKARQRDGAIVLSTRRTVTLSDIGEVMREAFGEVYEDLTERVIPTAGPPFVIYHGMPGPEDQPFEIQICAPVGRPTDAPSGWELTTLPGGMFVSCVHIGPYDTLGTTYQRLQRWIPTNGYALAGPPREVYLTDPTTPPEETRTVIEFPVVEAVTAVEAGRTPG